MSETVPFEGVEKRLVIQFADGHVHYDTALDLGVGDKMKSPLAMTAVEWQTVLDYASCEIVSEKELATQASDEAKADVRVYLLSESTLTVWSTGFLMKTCGRTTPFLALRRLLDLYRCKSLKDLHVSWMTYSRLDFLYPEFQPVPHRNFAEELEYAQRYFMSVNDDADSDNASTSASDGPSSPSGAATGSEANVREPYLRAQSFKDCESASALSYAAIPAGKHVLYAMFAAPADLAASGYGMEEVLMTQIRTDCVRVLTGADNKSEREVTAIDASNSPLRRELLKSRDSVLDEFWFDPCGYSANILFKNKLSDTIDYFSTHISPEECSSYASLECGTWGSTSSFCRSRDEFSLKLLIPAFEPKHQNFTRIIVTPMEDFPASFSPNETFRSETDESARAPHIFINNRFRCEIHHFAK